MSSACWARPWPARPWVMASTAQRQAIALMAVIGAAGGQQLPGGVAASTADRRRPALGILRPEARIAPALAPQPCRSSRWSCDGGTDVHQDRIAVGRNAEGDGIGREDRGDAAEGRHGRLGRIRGATIAIEFRSVAQRR